jgi:hypothetical protein
MTEAERLPTPLTSDALPKLRTPVVGMDALERRRWAAGFAVDSFGVRLGVRVDDPNLLPALARGLPPVWTAIEEDSPPVDFLFSAYGTSPRLTLYCNADLLDRNLHEYMFVLRFEFTARRYVTTRAPDFVFIHAGAVAWRGRAILVPAESQGGKSTLVAELVRAGAEYMSDEYGALDAQGRIHPYPKPLNLRRGTGEQVDVVPVESLGGQAASGPAPLGLVVATEFAEGTAYAPRVLRRGEGVLHLAGSALPMHRYPEKVFAALEHVPADTVFLGGIRGDAEEAARIILASVPASLGVAMDSDV